MELYLPDCLKTANEIELPEGTRVFQAGDECKQFVFLKRGAIRVNLVSQSGKSILLYRFGEGETCILTTACLLSGDYYSAEAIVEKKACAAIVPLATFNEMLEQSSEFRQLVFHSFAQRLSSMMAKIEDIAFVSIEQRLARRVMELGAHSDEIIVTHEQLAVDLGTAREVISRKLAQWEKKGWIERRRGQFAIREPQQLQRLLMV
ncbi:MAG: Crp/Fnr family transcriptional regulator [bacterium]